jgi:DNA-binding IclR family transcriptional regulator
MNTQDGEGKLIKATETAFDIIERITKGDHPSVSEVAAEVDYSRSTVHYHLATLRRNRYVVRDNEGYRLGLRMAHIGGRAQSHHRLSGQVEDTADELADEVEMRGVVAVEEAGKLVPLHCSSDWTLDETGRVRVAVGMELDMHTTAHGQAILASLPDERVESLLEGYPLQSRTEATITERGDLFDRLATVRELGIAYSEEEFAPGISSIAAPLVPEMDQAAVGAIGIVDRSDRIGDPYRHIKARRFSDELPGTIRRAAQIISDNLETE